jgi:hypothetical protein
MKRYIKLFEEFLLEGDPMADLMGGDEEGKDKEDPLEKKKKEDAAKEKKAKEKHEKKIDNNLDKIKKLFDKTPDIKDELKKKVIDAVESQDRIKVHNAFLDLTYAQQDYAENGNDKMVQALTPIKEIVDLLDQSYTNKKMM